MEKNIIQSYANIMDQRARGVLEEMGQFKQLVKMLKTDDIQSGKLIDFGCGGGHLLTSIRKISPLIQYTGIDKEEIYIENAKKLYCNDRYAEFHISDLDYLKRTPDNFFNNFVCYMVLPFIEDYREVLRNLIRITKFNGYMRLLLSDHTYLIKRRFNNSNFDYYYNIYSTDDFIRNCQVFGANKVEVLSDDFILNIPYTNPWDTYTMGHHQISGQIILPWRVVRLKKW